MSDENMSVMDETQEQQQQNSDANRDGLAEVQELKTKFEAQEKELADIRAALKKANEEAAKNRIAKNDANTQAEQAKTEAEQLLEKIEALQNSQAEMAEQLKNKEAISKQYALRVAITDAASKQNFVSPQDASAFLNTQEIEYDEFGNPVGVAELIEKLAKEKPYLIKKSSNSGMSVNPLDGRNAKETDEEKRARLSKYY